MKIFIFCLLFLFLCLSCKNKDEKQVYPSITDLEVVDITDTSAKFTFAVSPANIVKKASVMYSTESSKLADSLEVSTTSVAGGTVSLVLSGLDYYTNYYYRAYVTNTAGSSTYSSIYSFTTDFPPLEVSPVKIETMYLAGVFPIEILTKQEWTVSTDQSWCTVQPAFGDGYSEITVSLAENKSATPRSATVTIKADNITRQVVIEQSFLTISKFDVEMVLVEGGTFEMGCSSERDNDCYDEEMPVHQVTVSDFYMSKQEVTQELWWWVMGDSPSSFKGDGLPVENVSWNEVQEFISRLNTWTGKQYRLPTEAEWEYAARGGNLSKGYLYSGSNTLDDVAWYWLNIPSQTMGTEGYGTQPIGAKSPNELGIYDMSGNVFEWCHDWYGEYDSTTQIDPTGPESGTYRVVRGGSWNSNLRGMSLSFRGFIAPDSGNNYLGFRLVYSSSK